MKKISFILCLICLTAMLMAYAPVGRVNSLNVLSAEATPTPAPPYKLTILHTNDIHANHMPNAQGDGGDARAATVINKVRSEAPNTLLLNAGDNFTGSLFFYVHRGQDSVEVMNAMGYDVTTLGNHEFDDGIPNLAAYLGGLKFPAICANIDVSGESMLTDKIKPYAVIEKGGEKIGVIGLISPETPTMVTSVGNVKFDGKLADVAQKYIDELTATGINKIILLTHIGYAVDLELAKKVKGADVIVGGHSHTLVNNTYAGAAGPYPTVVKNDAGESVLVVQSGENGKFIGRLDVEFSPEGKITKFAGDLILLSKYITPDAQIEGILADLAEPIKKFTEEVIGEAAERLVGDRKVCRAMECNIGDLIADAARAETRSDVAIFNGGGIRASIEPGKVTVGDTIKVFPFSNMLSSFGLSGKDLLTAFENAVSCIDKEECNGRFAQVSGVRIQVDPKKPVGSRIVKVEVLDPDGTLLPLDPNRMYKVAAVDFIRKGGDGYTVLKEQAVNPYDFGRPIEQILADYIKTHSPVKYATDGRIEILK